MPILSHLLEYYQLQRHVISIMYMPIVETDYQDSLLHATEVCHLEHVHTRANKQLIVCTYNAYPSREVQDLYLRL